MHNLIYCARPISKRLFRRVIIILSKIKKFVPASIHKYFSCFATMEAIKASLLFLLFVIRLFSFASFFIILTYLKNKSPAMQTLKDEMMKEVIWSSLSMTMSLDFVWIR